MRIFTLLAVASLAVAPVLADWNVGDPYKMHFPQLPDPTGWDVNATFPNVVADDWLCTETGPVTDFHLWISTHGYNGPPPITGIHLSIHANQPGPPFSQPAGPPALWVLDLPVPMPGITIRPYGEGPEGWYDPATGQFNRPDHDVFYQINVTGFPNPFVQQAGTIYWLDASFLTPAGVPPVGWKTSMDQFMDAAVWGLGPAIVWQPLYDPETGGPLDMAFVITPEPASLLALGLLALGLRRR